MPTLVLSRRFSEDSNSMWRAAIAAGWSVERLMTYRVPEDLAHFVKPVDEKLFRSQVYGAGELETVTRGLEDRRFPGRALSLGALRA